MRVILFFLFLIAGCGYQLSGGQLPGNVHRLYIPLAKNQTAEPLVENSLAIPVTAVLARQKGVNIVKAQELSDGILQGVITNYKVVPLSYDSNDRISVFQSTLEVKFKLIHNPDGRLLWQGTIIRQQPYQAAVDKNQQENYESIAIDVMTGNIADDLLARLVTNF